MTLSLRHCAIALLLFTLTFLELGSAFSAEQRRGRTGEVERRREAAKPESANASEPNRRIVDARQSAKEPHANKVDGRDATLYEKYDKEGNFRKHGITKHQDPNRRYTAKQIAGGTVVRTDRGPRSEMIKKERDLVEKNPGPDNREPWAGKNAPNEIK